MAANDLTGEDFLAWWLDELHEVKGRGDHGRFLQLVAMGFVVVRIVQNPQPLLDALDELAEALTESLLVVSGREDIASGNVWPEEPDEE